MSVLYQSRPPVRTEDLQKRIDALQKKNENLEDQVTQAQLALCDLFERQPIEN